MANEDFSDKQIETLERLIRRIIDERIPVMLDSRFLEERKYLILLFRQELAELRQMVERIDERTDEDVRASGRDIATIKKRLTRLETDFVSLQAAVAR